MQFTRQRAAEELATQLAVYVVYARRLDHLLQPASPQLRDATSGAFSALRKAWQVELEAAGTRAYKPPGVFTGWTRGWNQRLWKKQIEQYMFAREVPERGFSLQEMCEQCATINGQPPQEHIFVDVGVFREKLQRGLQTAYPDLYGKGVAKNEHERLKSDIEFLLTIGGYLPPDPTSGSTLAALSRSATPWLKAIAVMAVGGALTFLLGPGAAMLAGLIQQSLPAGTDQMHTMDQRQGSQLRMSLTVNGYSEATASEKDEGVKHQLAFFQLVQKLYERHVDELAEPVQGTIGWIDGMIVALIQNKDVRWKHLLRRRQEVCLCLRRWPTRPLRHAVTSPERDHLEHRANSLTRLYRHLNLAHVIDPIRQNSLGGNGLLIYYLHGAPGVGKTRFWSDLASFFDIPSRKLVLDRRGAANLLSYGVRNPADWYDSNVSEEELLGTIPWLIVQHCCSNPVILIDEAQFLSQPTPPPFRDSLAAFLEPGRRSQDLAVAGAAARFDISSVTILLSGNLPVRDSAILSRLTTVFFVNMSAEAKEAALLQFLGDPSRRMRSSTLGDEGNERAIQRLRNLTRSLSADQLCREPGVRRLLWVFQFQLWAHAVIAEEQRAAGADRGVIEAAFQTAVVAAMLIEFGGTSEKEKKQYSARAQKAVYNNAAPQQVERNARASYDMAGAWLADPSVFTDSTAPPPQPAVALQRWRSWRRARGV